MSDSLTTSLSEVQDFYRLMWYGKPGTAKSTHIATAAKLGHLVYIDADNGLKPKALRRHGIPTDNIEVMQNITYDKVKSLLYDVAERLRSDPDSVFALAWDTTTKTMEKLLHGVVGVAVRKSQAKGVDRDESEIYLEDRGVVANQMAKLLHLADGLPCHFLVGAHERRDKDEDGGVVIGPGMGPSTALAFNGYMDCIMHARLQDVGGHVEASARTIPDGRFTAKDRFGLLPPNMVDPTFPRVLGYLEGEIAREEDPVQIEAKRRRGGVVASKPAPTTTGEAAALVEPEVDDTPDDSED